MKIIKKIDEYQSFFEILEDAAGVFAEKVFLVENGKEYTFESFNRLVNQCCHMLLSDGVKPKDIVSIVLKNSVDYLIIYFAALKLGCKINPFPFHLSSNEIQEKASYIAPRIIYAHAAHAQNIKDPKLHVKLIQSDKEDLLHARLIAFSDQACAVPEMSPDETAFLYYSSGTTGSPKIIEYSTRSEICAMASLLRASFIRPGDCHICVLPLGHTAAIRYTIWPCLLTGSKVILFESFWKIRAEFWKLVHEYKVTFVEIVPTILVALLNTKYEEFKSYDLRSLRFMACGSAFLSKNLQDKFEEKFGVLLANMYGLSETGATHFDNPLSEGRKTGTVGRPLDIMTVKVFDEQGVELKAGALGEFGVKGPSLLRGYYRSLEQYQACFKGEYFMTGDLGYVDEQGIFYYVDRKKDLIIKGGVNIVPSQIDEVVLTHPSVQDVATIGKPDMFLGEVIKCFVVLKESCLVDAKELKEFSKKILGDFKSPSEIEFVDELPKGPSGKVLRRKLREKEIEKLCH